MAEVAKINNASSNPVTIDGGYSSIKSDDFDTRKVVYNAINNADSLSDHLGEDLTVKDILVQPVESENEKTGELEEYLRTTFILEDGTALSAGSDGVATAVRNMLYTIGEPHTWPEPVVIRVTKKPSTKRKGYEFFSVELV